MRHWSLRAKLTAWSALVVGIAVLICGVGTGFYIQHEQIEALDSQLASEAHTFFGELARANGTPDWTQREQVKAIPPVTMTERFVKILGPDGALLFTSKNADALRAMQLPAGARTVEIGGKKVHVGVYSENGFTLCLGVALSEIEADASQLLIGFLIGLPLFVALVAGGGWWLARKALSPVREIAAAAEQITAERLDTRLPVPPARDEIGRLAEVLNATLDRLDTAFRQAVRFSADASHELKTPLTVLRASIEDLLESPALAEADREAVSALLEQTRRLSSITECLLLLSRADAGRLKLDFAETDVREIIHACVEDARIMAGPRGIEIETELPAGLRAPVDAGRLSQILLNLLDNAVKYNRDGGRVKVSATAENGALTIAVANTGAGIPREGVPHLFERFYRSDSHDGASGHGLGLSIARELARAHGGDVALVKSDSAWTVFAIRLAAVAKCEPAIRSRAFADSV